MSNIIQEMSTLSMKDYIIKNHELDKFKLLYLENAPRLIFYASKYVDSDTADSVYREIAKLPDRCREVFTLAYVDGKKSVEIAGMLNISQRTVEAQLYKGLKIIRNVLALLALVLFFR